MSKAKEAMLERLDVTIQLCSSRDRYVAKRAYQALKHPMVKAGFVAKKSERQPDGVVPYHLVVSATMLRKMMEKMDQGWEFEEYRGKDSDIISVVSGILPEGYCAKVGIVHKRFLPNGIEVHPAMFGDKKVNRCYNIGSLWSDMPQANESLVGMTNDQIGEFTAMYHRVTFKVSKRTGAIVGWYQGRDREIAGHQNEDLVYLQNNIRN